MVRTNIRSEQIKDDSILVDDLADFAIIRPPSTASSLLFGGVNGYVSIPTSSSLDIIGSFSLSLWIKTAQGTSGGNGSVVLEKSDNNTNYFLLMSGAYSGALTVGINVPSGIIYGTQPINDDTWHHVVLMYDASATTLYLYIDNVLSQTQTGVTNTLSPSGQALHIGSRSGGYPFAGKLDDIRLYSKILSTGEIATLSAGGSPSSSDLDLYLRIDGLIGITVPDLSGNNNNGTFTGDVSWSADVSTVLQNTGLNVVVQSGRVRNGVLIIQTNSVPLTLVNNSTNYIEIDNLGTVTFNTSEFTSGKVPLATVTTASGNVTSITDKRAWISVSDSFPKLTDNIAYYVDPVGSDITGDGSSGLPFATISHALSLIPKNLNSYNAIITVNAGAYTQDAILVGGFFDSSDQGTGQLYIQGTGTIGDSNIANVSNSIFIINDCTATINITTFGLLLLDGYYGVIATNSPNVQTNNLAIGSVGTDGTYNSGIVAGVGATVYPGGITDYGPYKVKYGLTCNGGRQEYSSSSVYFGLVLLQFGGNGIAVDGANGFITTPSATPPNPYCVANKKYVDDNIIGRRVVPMIDDISITPTGDTADINTQVNTQVVGTLTVNAPTGTPIDGQKLIIRLNSVNIQTFAWNGVYRGSVTTPLPTVSTGSSKTDYIEFKFTAADNFWDCYLVNLGF